MQLLRVSEYAASGRNIAGKKVSVKTVYEWIKLKKVESVTQYGLTLIKVA